MSPDKATAGEKNVTSQGIPIPPIGAPWEKFAQDNEEDPYRHALSGKFCMKNGLILDYEESLSPAMWKKSENKNSPFPSWRAVDFTLVLALPAPYTNDGKNLSREPLDLPQWVQGRDIGICRVAFRQGDPKHSRDTCHPQVFYKTSKNIFKKTIGESVGAERASIYVVPHADKRKSFVDQNKEEPAGEPKHIFHHVTFDKTPGAYFLLDQSFDDRGERNAEIPSGSVFLRAVEVAQFWDTASYNKKDTDARPTSTFFLILHVVAENVSDRTLFDISASLCRKRNPVAPLPMEGYTPALNDERTSYKEFNLLEHFTEVALHHLNHDQKLFDCEVSSGGFIQYKDKSRINWNKLRPFRLVSAIPFDDKDDSRVYPPIFAAKPLCNTTADDTGEAGGGNFSHDRWIASWAWTLASGADQFFSGIPDLKSLLDNDYQVDRYDNWETAITEDGVAYVRRVDAVRGVDYRPNRAVSTYFTDLALLNMRAARELEYLHRELQKASGIDGKEDRATELGSKLDRLNVVQTRLANFRKELWFEAVPQRKDCTALLNALQKHTGTEETFKDFLTQLEIQQQIVDTQYKQVEKEQEKQQQERDKQQQEDSERRNGALGIIGLLIAAFSVFGAFGVTLPGGCVWAVIVTVIIVVIIAYVLMRKRPVLLAYRKIISELKTKCRDIFLHSRKEQSKK